MTVEVIFGVFSRLKCDICPGSPCTETDSHIPYSQISSKALRSRSQYGHFSDKNYMLPIINLTLCNIQMKLFKESKTGAVEQKLLLYLAAPEESEGRVPRAPESAGSLKLLFP